MGLDDRFHDGQAQAGSLAIALAGRVDAVEAIEQVGQVSGGLQPDSALMRSYSSRLE